MLIITDQQRFDTIAALGFPGPHPPHDPPARYAEPYLARSDLPLPAPSARELDGLPAALKEKRHHDVPVDHDSFAWDLDPSPEQMRRVWAHDLGNVTLIDEKGGELLASLERRGDLDDAVVIFTSDHGECLGDHGLSQKWSMYDAADGVVVTVVGPSGCGQSTAMGLAADNGAMARSGGSSTAAHGWEGAETHD